MFNSCMDWIMSPSDSYVEAITLNITLFGDRTFKEVLNVQWNQTDEMDSNGVLTPFGMSL